MKIYIICCVPGQILYWEKSCSWDIGQNALSQSDCSIFKSIISPEQIDEIVVFFACWHKFTKIKSWWKIFCLGSVKRECGEQYDLWTLKLPVFQKWTEQMELTDFLHSSTNSSKLKCSGKFLEWAWSKMGVASLVMGL